MTGPYGRKRYVASLCPDDGELVALWGGWVILRPITGTDRKDAITAYPLGGFERSHAVKPGLDALRERGAVTLTLVADPLCAPDLEMLTGEATLFRHLKTHYTVDLERGPFRPTKHHRYEIKRARQRCEVMVMPFTEVIEEWRGMYDALFRKHGVPDGAKLPEKHFEALQSDPQATVFVAKMEADLVAMSIWLSDGSIAHNHLGASSDAGYQVGASYALYAAAIDTFQDHRVLDLGGMPGATDDPNHGLARFKRGFANATISTSLAGFVLDEAGYQEICEKFGRPRQTEFFPAYRAPLADEASC